VRTCKYRGFAYEVSREEEEAKKGAKERGIITLSSNKFFGKREG